MCATTVAPVLADDHDAGRGLLTSRGGRHEVETKAPPPQATAPAPVATPDATPVPAPAQPTPTVASRVVDLAQTAIGSPYVFGGSSPVTGFDCSGLVHWVLGQLGFDLGRTAAAQFQQGTPVSAGDLVPGDLVFFSNTYMPGLSHVGIYVGDGQFVDAGTERTGVRRASLSDPYWASRFAGARRLR
jgi:cell wall-associated NlpC family hydrolase